MFDSVSCSFTFISFLTITLSTKQSKGNKNLDSRNSLEKKTEVKQDALVGLTSNTHSNSQNNAKVIQRTFIVLSKYPCHKHHDNS
jgi:hypothetical protein